jgi:MobA-like NTP transferase domain/Phosphotransferase enzyme family
MAGSQMHVIVQAGGRGSRLRHHTWNKPKCLVSVRNKPLLYRLFERFPEAKFIVIGDYAFDQLEKYLEVNPPGPSYELIKATDKGTSSGIAAALKKVPKDAPFVLTWSDLIIGDLPPWPDGDKPVMGITSAFTCRWSINEAGIPSEATSAQNGIPGLFYFPRASLLPNPPENGEFVRWFAANINDFTTIDCPKMEELGDFATIEESNNRDGFSRFFNKVEIKETEVIKTVVDPAYQEVHKREIAWYRDASELGFRRIPKLISTEPLVMERIRGHHLYQMNDLTEREQRAVIADYLDALISLHDKARAPASQKDIQAVYLTKTIKRVQEVAKIIPGFQHDSMTINGKKCRNIFAEKHAGVLESLLPILMPDHFAPIHGDATFSNTLVDDKLRVWFIDPRGYFAEPGIMGDVWYDFAKVHYSAVGGYDGFNRRKFKLHIDDETVEILMEEPRLAKSARTIFDEYFKNETSRIEILHGLIWLSLSGYAKDDIDSVIGSFYLGLYWLEQGISMR